METPNTKILCGKLKKSDLEKFVEIYKKIGLNVTSSMPSIDSINDDNKKLREFEITPNPFGEADNKLLIGIKCYENGKLCIHTQIHPGENSIKNPNELKKQYDKLIKYYFLRE